MNSEFIRTLLKAEPFVPFRILMSNGDSSVVKHPENAIVMKTRMIVYYPETDNMGFLSLLHIDDIKIGDHAEINK